jgi:PAS domain S-box-containing protein
MLLVVLLACASTLVCSRTFAEEQATMNTGTDRSDQAVQDTGTTGKPEDQPRTKKVLVLHTLKVKRPWNVLFNRYFTEALQESGLSLANLDIENLDLLQFKDADYRETVKRQLEHKYADMPPDVIIITFASTIDFVLENDLFPDIPRIFVLPTPSDFEGIPDSVVLPFAFEFRNNIAHALTLLPDTKSIYVVAGNGLMDKRLVSMFRSDTEDLEDRVSFHYLDDLNVEELLGRLENLPDDSFVYYLTYSLDFQGKAVITRDFSQRIGDHSNRPVLSWLDLHALNIDILGGRVTTTKASATMSLDVVKRVFEGESIDSIEPPPPYVEYIYQWEELKKWGIDPGRLSPKSIIQNKTYSFFDVFKWRITGGIVLIALEALLILFFLISIRRRKAAEQGLKGYQHELEEKVRALQESESRLSLIYDSVGDVLFYIRVEPDDCFRFVSVNHAFLETTRLTGDQIVGKRIEEVIPEPSIQLVLDNYRKAIRENMIVRWEETSVYPSGERIGDVSIAPVVNEEGICTHLVGSVHDVTERRQAEQTLRESEERYEVAVAGSAAGIWDWDIPSGNVYYSGRFKELLGYGGEEPWETTDDFWNRVHPDDLPTVREALERHLEERVAYRMDFRLQTRSGEYRWFYARGQALWDEAGKPLRMAGSITDVTQHKEADEGLLRSEHRFRSLMEQFPQAVVLFTPEGKPIQVNSAWKKLWGVDDNGTAEFFKKYNPLDDNQLRDRGMADLIKKGFAGEHVVLPPLEYSGKQTTEELDFNDGEANTAWIQIHLSPVFDEKHEINCIVNTVVDITALKRSEEESNRQRENLARMSRVTRMEQMTGSIAHELNQPLTGILSNAQAGEMMVKDGRCDSGDMAEIMGEIASDAKRASDVIQTLRDLYRKHEMEYRPVDMSALIEETEHLLRSEFILQKVEMANECAPDAPPVGGTRVQLQQVLVNLIMNAAEAMKDTSPDGRLIRVATSHDKDEVRVWVEDSGPGIDADRIDTIFEPLATWKPGGTGMGLAISNSIIEAHRGRMWAENRDGGGACVGFVLPVMKGSKGA